VAMDFYYPDLKHSIKTLSRFPFSLSMYLLWGNPSSVYFGTKPEKISKK